jgi:RNA polymerase sigma factor (sigma-70 family)
MKASSNWKVLQEMEEMSSHFLPYYVFIVIKIHSSMKQLNYDPNKLKQAFSKFYDIILFVVYRITKNRAEAEDITMHSFLKLRENRDTESMTLIEIKRFLFMTAKNEAIDYLRKMKSRNNWLNSQDAKEVDVYTVDWEFEEKFAVYAEAVKKLIEEESARRKEILELYYLQGKKTTEISAQLNISPSTVNNTLSKAINNLREKFKKMGLLKR